MKITKLRSEDAQAIGLAKFQQIYPNGTISKEILKEASVNVSCERDACTLFLAFWLRERFDPYIFFEVTIDRYTSETTVVIAEDASSLSYSALRLDVLENGRLR